MNVIIKSDKNLKKSDHENKQINIIKKNNDELGVVVFVTLSLFISYGISYIYAFA
jgi:hypothetical protein